MRGLPARTSVVISAQLGGKGRMRDLQLLGGFQDPLIETAAGLDADDDQIERVRKPVLDPALALGGQPPEHHARNQVADQPADRQHPSTPSIPTAG